MTTFLFSAVAVSGLAIVARRGCVPLNRRNRFILTASLALGYGATLAPGYFGRVFSSSHGGSSRDALRGLMDAVELVMGTGFAVTAAVGMVLNWVLPVEVEDTPAVGQEGEEGEPEQRAVGVGRRESGKESEEVKGGKAA